MTLHDAVKRYLVYLQALRIPASQLSIYRQTMQDVLNFYDRETPLGAFDDQTVLEYVLINDPFDTRPHVAQRGEAFCNLISWLMQNDLIPAWADQKNAMNECVDFDPHEALDDYPLS